jgi:hypothetical protein
MATVLERTQTELEDAVIEMVVVLDEIASSWRHVLYIITQEGNEL